MLSLKHALRSLFQRPEAPVRQRSEPKRLRMEWLEDRTLLCNPGELDLTFGTGGKVTTDFGTGTFEGANAMALQVDGKIIAAGVATDSKGRTEFAVARYNSNGTLDTSFDGDGKLVTQVGGVQSEARAVAVQSDGKIVVAGYAQPRVGVDFDFAVVRYNVNGSLDTSFGKKGIVLSDFAAAGDFIRAMIIQPNGKIVAAGYTETASGNDIAMARYNTNGTLDTSFGGTGKVTTDLGGNNDVAWGVALQSDGKIIAAGRQGSGSTSVALVRYNSNGSLDSSFGTGGVVTTAVGSSSFASSVALQSDGAIVVAGRTTGTSGNNDFVAVRYNTSGGLDTTFDTDGIQTVDFAGGDDLAAAVQMQTNGQIVLGGISSGAFALARLNTDGTLDAAFGTDGQVTTDFSAGTDRVWALAIQTDGQIVAAGSANFGTTNPNFALARYCA